jgi:hypothetical protein
LSRVEGAQRGLSGREETQREVKLYFLPLRTRVDRFPLGSHGVRT